MNQYKNFLYPVVIISYLLLSYSIFLFLDEQDILFLTKEDSVYEYGDALFFLIASIIFFLIFLKSKSGNDFKFIKTRKNIFYLLLALVFFLGAGEEVSWCQRIFNIETPESLKQINIQEELNIHNLQIFHKGEDNPLRDNPFWGWFLVFSVDRIVSLFWFFYCLVIPILNKFSPRFNNFLKRINLPIVPIFMGVFFMVNFIISKMIIASHMPGELNWPAIEVRENNFAFLFMLVGIYLFQRRDSV